MAGHTSEKRWRQGMNPQAPNEPGVSQRASDICTVMIKALTEADAAFAELQEVYAYAGGTVQGLADLLFKEDFEARTVPGTNAVIEVDVASGVVSNAVIVNGGLGYVDGNYVLALQATAGGGDGTATLNYTVAGGVITVANVTNGGDTYTDGLGQTVQEVPLAGPTPETQANAEEVAKTQDLFDAITALREIYQCANNVVVAQEDRLAQLRRLT